MEETHLSAHHWVRNIMYILIVLFVVAGIFIIVSQFTSSTGDITKKIDNDAYFAPPSEDEMQRSVSGKINKMYNVIENDKVKHELLDKDGNRLAYLYSSTNNLDLSIGLYVEVTGAATRERASGVEIIRVETIKYK